MGIPLTNPITVAMTDNPVVASCVVAVVDAT